MGESSVWRIGPVAVPWAEAGFRQGVHIKPWRCSSQAVHRWDIAPRGWGSPVAGVEHPPPLSHASPVERFSLDHPHRPARSAPPPAPCKGAGSVWRLARIECTGSRGRIFGGCQVRPRRDCQILGDCIHGESPRGGGADGVGGGTSPSPVSCVTEKPLSLDGPPPLECSLPADPHAHP